ncbi:hypothetical protein GCM10023185_38680 [Hymenobacter saemangeumensis]|uniref:Uncharacterized protein n=1 Tax=Hymenobacter saemangeumensis TaxID=1084522 RepID=A0ABP8IQK0_9BACT
MRYLFFLFSLLLSVSTAFAQTEKAPVVTKLPGEENLSLRERAERDFLMPVRRKKVVSEAARAAAEDGTAAPESDVTAHATEVADDVRTVEEAAAPAREVRTVRHASHRSAHRTHAPAKAHTSKKSVATKTSHHAAKKSSSHKASAKKVTAKKAPAKKAAAPAKKASTKKAASTSAHSKKKKHR